MAPLELKFNTKLNELLSKESIQDSDYKNYVKTLNVLTKSIQHKKWFNNYAPVVKDWISAFETIFNRNKMEGDHQILDKLCSATTEVFLNLLQCFHQFEPKYTQEFYSHWKSVLVRINKSKRASTFVRHISHFKVVIEHLKTAYHRCEQLTILSVLKLYIETVTSDELTKLKVHDNSGIVDKLIELMKNPTFMNQNQFLHEIDAMGDCITSMEPTKIVCDKLKMQCNSSEHKMWVDFNLKDKSVNFITISLKNTVELRSLALGCHIKMRENDENMIEINGAWNFLTNNKDPFKKRVTIKVFLAHSIPESVKNGFHFVHSTFVGSISQVMIEREPSPKDGIDDSNIETSTEMSESGDSIASISSMVATINKSGNGKLLTQTVQDELEIADNGRNILKKIELIGDDRSRSQGLSKSVIPIAVKQLENDRNQENSDKGEEVTPTKRINESTKKSIVDKCADKLLSIERDNDTDSDILFRDLLSVSEDKNYDDSENETNESENDNGYSNSAWEEFVRNVRLTGERFNESFVIPSNQTQQNESFLNFESTVQDATKTRTVKYMHTSQIEMALPTKQMRHLNLYSQPTTSRERYSMKASQMEQIPPKRSDNVYVQKLPVEKSATKCLPMKNHSQNRNEMINQSIEPVHDPQKSVITTEQQNVSQNKTKFFNRSIDMPQSPQIQGVSQNPSQANRQIFTKQPSEKVQLFETAETAASSQARKKSQDQTEHFASLPVSNRSSHGNSSLIRLPEEATKTVPAKAKKNSEERSNMPNRVPNASRRITRNSTKQSLKGNTHVTPMRTAQPCKDASSSPKSLKESFVLPSLNQNQMVTQTTIQEIQEESLATPSRQTTRNSTKQPSKYSKYVPSVMHSSQIDMQLSPQHIGHRDIYSQPTTSPERSLIKCSSIDLIVPKRSEHVYVQDLAEEKSSVESSPMKNDSHNRSEMINQSVEPVQDPRNRSMIPEPQNVSLMPRTQKMSQIPYEMFRPQTTSTQNNRQRFSQLQSENDSLFGETPASTQRTRSLRHEKSSLLRLPENETKTAPAKAPASTQKTRYAANSQTLNSLKDQTANFVSLPVSGQTSHEKSSLIRLPEKATKTAPAKTKKDSVERSKLSTMSSQVTRNATKEHPKGSSYVPPMITIQPSEKALTLPTQNSLKSVKESSVLPSSIQKLSENKIVESVVPPTKAIQHSEERLNLATMPHRTTQNSTKQPFSSLVTPIRKIQTPEIALTTPTNPPKASRESFHLPTPESVIPPVIASQPSQKPSTSKQRTTNAESFVQPSITQQKVWNMSTTSSGVAAKKLSSKKCVKRLTTKADSIKPVVVRSSTAQNSTKNRTESFVPEDDWHQMENDEMSNRPGSTPESVQEAPKSLRRESSQHIIESFVPDIHQETVQRLATRNDSWKVKTWIDSLPTHSTQNTSKHRSDPSQDISARKPHQVPRKKSPKIICSTNDEPFQRFDDVYSTSNNIDDEPYDMPKHNEAETRDNIRIGEAGMISDEKGCVFANNDELQQAANFFIEKEGLAYMKTQAFKALNVKTREKIERQFRTIHTMMNRGLNNLHRDDHLHRESSKNDPYKPGYSELVCQNFKKPKSKMRLMEEMSFTVFKQNTKGKTADTKKVSFAITHRRISKIYQVNDDDTASTSTFARQMPPKRQNSSPIPSNEKKFFKKTKFFHVKEPSYKNGVNSKSKVNLSTIKSPIVKRPIYASEKEKAAYPERQMFRSLEGGRDVGMECADPILDDRMEVSNENRVEKLPIYATEKLKGVSSTEVERYPPSTDLTVNDFNVNASISDGLTDTFNRVDELPRTGMTTSLRKRKIGSSKQKCYPSVADVNMAYDDQLVENASAGDDPIDVFDVIRVEEPPAKGIKKTTIRKRKISSSTDLYVDRDKRKVDEPNTNAPIDDVPIDILNEYCIEEQPSKRMKTTSRDRKIFASKNEPLRVDNPMDAFNENRIEKVPINTSARLETTNRKQTISSLTDTRRDRPSADIAFPDPNVGDVGNLPSTSNAINGNNICKMAKCDANMKDVISTMNESLKDPCAAHVRIMTDFIKSLQIVDLQRDPVINGLTYIVNATMASLQLICDNAIAQCEAIEKGIN